MLAKLFRYPDGAWPNLAALAYAVLGWMAGIALLCARPPALNALGVLLVAHSLAIGAYLIHECAHGTIFAARFLGGWGNDLCGAALGWISGACLAPYEGLKEKHLRHHADRLDVVAFDYRAVLNAAPKPMRAAMLALEWAYVPAVELLMRGLIVATALSGPWRSKARILTILAVRIAALTLLGIVSIKALLLYGLAYILFLHILRFQDAFQHTYDLYVAPSHDQASFAFVRDRAYEHANTYSDVVSIDHPLLNLLVLNFAYHNAHHAKPAQPWYRLPALHQALYAEDRTQVLPLKSLLRSYHRHRVARVLAPAYGHVAPDGDRASGFLGAVGVSFLTAI